MRQFLLWVGVLVIATALASAQEIEWTRQFGTPGFEVARANAIDGMALYVFGVTAGALPGQTYAGGPGDVFLRKYDLSGNEVWTRQFGTSGDDFAGSGPIAVDETGVYVVGLTDGTLPGQTNAGSSDVFVRKYDFNGNEVWTRQFGTPGFDFADGIAAGRGSIYVVGSVDGALPGQTHGGSFDAFVRRYDSAGNLVWTRQFGSSGSEDLHAVSVDPTRDGGVYAAGSVTTLPDFEGDSDALVVRYDFAGNQIWSRQFGTVDLLDHAGGVAVRHGEIYVTGFTHGTLPGQTSAGGRDIFVRKYDANGNDIWTRQFGTSGSDGGEVIGTAVDGRGVYVASNVGRALPGHTSAGSSDAFVRLYDPSGNNLLTIQFGSSGPDRAQAISVDDAALYVSGRVGGALPGQTYAGDQDAFVVKFQKRD